MSTWEKELRFLPPSQRVDVLTRMYAAERALADDLADALDAMLREAPTGVTTATASHGRETMARYQEARQR